MQDQQIGDSHQIGGLDPGHRYSMIAGIPLGAAYMTGVIESVAFTTIYHCFIGTNPLNAAVVSADSPMTADA